MKVICISDIHLAHFTNYSFYPGFRDEQFLRLADRIIEIANERNSTELLVLGDLIDKPILDCDAQHLVVKFLQKLSSHFTSIRYILGQHDLAKRNDVVAYTDSIVNIFDTLHVIKYSHGESFQLGGRNFYMTNWCKGDVPACPEGTDVFCSHVTISSLFGQSFEDPNSFKLGVFGDIHASVDIGHIHSCGCPLQKSLSESPYGTVSVIDTDDLSYERVQVITDKYKFLRIYREGEEVDPDEYTHIIKSRKKVTSIKLESEDESLNLEVSLSEINKVIDKIISEKGLTELHNKFKVQCPSSDPINLDFKLTKLIVSNFKSIKHFELDFNKYKGLKYVHGVNGSGKSVLIQSLMIALLGDRRIRAYQKIGCDEPVRLEVELTYENSTYRIVRYPGGTEFYINGVMSNGSGKVDTENKIYSTLPFLNYQYLFWVAHNKGFFNSFKTSQLLENMFGLNSLVNFQNLSVTELNNSRKLLNQVRLVLSNLEGNLSAYQTQIDSLNGKLDDLIDLDDTNYSEKKIKLVKLNNSILELESQLSEINLSDLPEETEDDLTKQLSLIQESKLEIEGKVNSCNERTRLVKRIDEVESLINSSKITCSNCGTVNYSNPKLVDDLKSLETKLETYQVYDLSELKLELNKLSVKKSELNNKLNLIKSNFKLIDHKNNLESKLSSYRSKLSELLGESTYDDAIKICDTEISKLNEIKSIRTQISDLTEHKLRCNKDIKSANEKISELEIDIYDLSRYYELFNKNSDSSIYKAILVKINETLSDDELSFVTEDGDIRFRLKVGNHWMDYQDMSDGQKALSDLILIQRLLKLLGTTGLLILDEVACNLDQSKYDRFSQLVTEFDCNDMLLTMHSSEFQSYDHSIRVELIDNNSQFEIN